MLDIRTDLADELRTRVMAQYAEENKGKPDGILYREETLGHGITKSTVSVINEAGASALGKPKGDYITFSFPGASDMDYTAFCLLYRSIATALRDLAESMCGKPKRLLFCGLGNRDIIADALGPLVADRVLATHHIKEKDSSVFENLGFFDVSVLAPGVSAQTGMEAQTLIRAAVHHINPSLVIAMDALCAGERERLTRTVQLCTSGIAPGSGIGNCRAGLSKETLGVPVLGMGVPTVMDIDALVPAAQSKKAVSAPLIVSPKDMDKTARVLSVILSYAVNTAFQKGLSAEEMALM